MRTALLTSKKADAVRFAHHLLLRSVLPSSAAGIWITAAIGVAVGVGSLGLALLGTLLAWVVLASIGVLENA